MKKWIKILIIVLLVVALVSTSVVVAISAKRSEWKKTDKAVDTSVEETVLPDYTNGNVFDIYLDQTAGDNGDGTKSAPYNSVDKALEKIAEVQQNSGNYDAIRLNINGLYEVNKSIDFESIHTTNLPVIVKGENDATISGGYSFKGGWTEYKDGIYQYPIKVDAFRTLFVDG